MGHVTKRISAHVDRADPATALIDRIIVGDATEEEVVGRLERMRARGAPDDAVAAALGTTIDQARALAEGGVGLTSLVADRREARLARLADERTAWNAPPRCRRCDKAIPLDGGPAGDRVCDGVVIIYEEWPGGSWRHAPLASPVAVIPHPSVCRETGRPRA
jgi:hypothetical protein